MYSTSMSDDEIKITANKTVIAKFTDCGNGMDGMIEEFDHPNRMLPSQMIELARWLLEKAQDRTSSLEI